MYRYLIESQCCTAVVRQRAPQIVNNLIGISQGILFYENFIYIPSLPHNIFRDLSYHKHKFQLVHKTKNKNKVSSCNFVKKYVIIPILRHAFRYYPDTWNAEYIIETITPPSFSHAFLTCMLSPGQYFFQVSKSIKIFWI